MKIIQHYISHIVNHYYRTYLALIIGGVIVFTILAIIQHQFWFQLGFAVIAIILASLINQTVSR